MKLKNANRRDVTLEIVSKMPHLVSRNRRELLTVNL
jgi:hypothetical protein